MTSAYTWRRREFYLTMVSSVETFSSESLRSEVVTAAEGAVVACEERAVAASSRTSPVQ